MKKHDGATKVVSGGRTVLWAEEMAPMGRRITDAYGLSPERSVSHRLTITTDDGFACDCGEPFAEVIELEWHQHRFLHMADPAMSAGRAVAERTSLPLEGTPMGSDWVETTIFADLAAANDDEYVAFICALGERLA